MSIKAFAFDIICLGIDYDNDNDWWILGGGAPNESIRRNNIVSRGLFPEPPEVRDITACFPILVFFFISNYFFQLIEKHKKTEFCFIYTKNSFHFVCGAFK